MTTKSQKSEKNTLKIEDVLKPLFEGKAPKRDLVNAVWDFQDFGDLSINEIEKVLQKAKTDLGFVFDATKTMADIKTVVKNNTVPVKNFAGIQKFIAGFADEHFSTIKIVDKMFKTVLGDVYPIEGKKMLSGTKQEQGFKILFENLDISEHELFEFMLGKGKYPRIVITTKEGIIKPVSDGQIKKTKDAIVDYISIVKLFNSKLTLDQIDNLL